MTAPPAPPGPPGSPAREARPPFDALFMLAALALAGAIARVVFFTPVEATQGAAQKIYYIHVPSALSAYLALFVTALMSLVYLWLRDERADRMAESAGEVSIVFLTAVLITGPLWGKPVWGTWWDRGDVRLTLTLFLWFVNAAYLVLRGAVDDATMRARYSAVLAVLGALLVPFIHLSVYMFRTLHPMPIVLKPERPSLPAEMLVTFVVASLAVMFYAIALMRARYRLAALQRDLEALP